MKYEMPLLNSNNLQDLLKLSNKEINNPIRNEPKIWTDLSKEDIQDTYVIP